LFEVIRELKATGIAILYISHFLEEVEAIADRFSVLRDGKTVGSGALSGVSRQQLIELMAGRELLPGHVRSPRTPGEVVVELDDLSGADGRGTARPTAASLRLHRGEVLGIAGLLGSGRSELLRAIFGLAPITAGRIRIKGQEGPRCPRARLAQGVGLLSEDRKEEGLAQKLSLADNVTLSRASGLGPPGLTLPSRMTRVTESLIARLGIRCRSAWQRAGELSGGNQQKVALARLLHQDADIVLLDEPTRGVDVHSRTQIYQIIDEWAKGGRAILMVSNHQPELIGVCDRIQVMRRGVLGPSHHAREVTEHELLSEAIG